MPRHITFMALGMTIGTGLFLGSGRAISLAGPSVLLAYLFSGMMVWLFEDCVNKIVELVKIQVEEAEEYEDVRRPKVG